ncbi:MAG TPA: BamA/TamA family outer membrane protein [Bryobacteraceae bacterium]|nr:BamA/TamA family outer membrane protein [Bryobacteraceae bacterium]
MVAAVLSLVLLPAQSLRLNGIEAERKTRPPHVESDEAPSIERAFNERTGRRVLKPLDDGWYGFRLKLGGITPGSGIAAGPEFVHRGSRATFRTSARHSVIGYQTFDGELALPYLAGERAFANALYVHRSLPRMPYYGAGPNSREDDRANYHLKDSSFELTVGVGPVENFRIGAVGGWLHANVGQGRDARYPSVLALFGQPAIGLTSAQADYATAGAFLEYDTTDVPGSPRGGGDYSLRVTKYGGSHNRVDVRAQHYLPFFSRQRVIALRAWSAFTDAPAERAVPFYLQPTLGGPDTLRGYNAYRFHDNNSLLLNAEYRWKISSGIDMAVFTDQGKVFPRMSELNFREWKSSYGAGVRLNTRQNVFMRVDFGCGGEGCAVWLRFNNVY